MQPVDVQRIPLPHAASFGVYVHAPALQPSMVHATPSSHVTAMPGVHIPSSQRSIPLHALPSAHSAAVVHSGGGPASVPGATGASTPVSRTNDGPVSVPGAIGVSGRSPTSGRTVPGASIGGASSSGNGASRRTPVSGPRVRPPLAQPTPDAATRLASPATQTKDARQRAHMLQLSKSREAIAPRLPPQFGGAERRVALRRRRTSGDPSAAGVCPNPLPWRP